MRSGPGGGLERFAVSHDAHGLLAKETNAMNTNRLERSSANELTAQVQENASELARSVGDLAGKFIQEQPYTATLMGLSEFLCVRRFSVMRARSAL